MGCTLRADRTTTRYAANHVRTAFVLTQPAALKYFRTAFVFLTDVQERTPHGRNSTRQFTSQRERLCSEDVVCYTRSLFVCLSLGPAMARQLKDVLGNVHRYYFCKHPNFLISWVLTFTFALFLTWVIYTWVIYFSCGEDYFF